MYPRLSLEQAPPISAPLRFFFTAPLFGILVSAVVLLHPEALSQRWLPLTLSITHLLVLGVLSMIMIGALFQMLPVMAGTPVPGCRWVAPLVHGGFSFGVLCLAGALAMSNSLLSYTSSVLLVSSLLLFLLATGNGLYRSPRYGALVIRLAIVLVALCATLLLGFLLLAGHTLDSIPLFRASSTNLHIAWGLFGWIGMLVVTVSFQVVPMFQLTPEYPQTSKNTLVIAMFTVLITWTLGSLAGRHADAGGTTLQIIALLLLSIFALQTLYLQSQRRRKLPDASLLFWRFALIALLTIIALWLLYLLRPMPEYWSDKLAQTGVLLFLCSFTLSLIIGMLYKIVPFLVWFHLQQHANSVPQFPIPGMKKIIPPIRMKIHFVIHITASILIVSAILQPGWLVRVAAFLYLASFVILLSNLTVALKTYHKCRSQIAELSANEQPVDKAR